MNWLDGVLILLALAVPMLAFAAGRSYGRLVGRVRVSDWRDSLHQLHQHRQSKGRA